MGVWVVDCGVIVINAVGEGGARVSEGVFFASGRPTVLVEVFLSGCDLNRLSSFFLQPEMMESRERKVKQTASDLRFRFWFMWIISTREAGGGCT